MAIFEDKKGGGNGDSYIAILDNTGDIVAFVNPARGVSQELLVTELTKKKLKVEIRDPKEDRTTLKL